MAEAGEQVTGTRDEDYDLISVLYHSLQGASEVQHYIRDAEEAGDQELVEFLGDYQEAQRDLSERAKTLLGVRLMRRTGRAGLEEKLVVDATPGQKQERTAGSQINAQLKSGGRKSDDIVDEQSKESFPASDSPSRY